MKKLLLALLLVSATSNIFAGFSDDNLEAHESYRSVVGSKGKMHSDEVQANWESFKGRIQKKKPAQKVKPAKAKKAGKKARAAQAA